MGLDVDMYIKISLSDKIFLNIFVFLIIENFYRDKKNDKNIIFKCE